MSKWITDSRLGWEILNGVFLIFKPPGIHYLNVRKTIIQNLCRGKKILRMYYCSTLIYSKIIFRVLPKVKQ